MVADESVPTRIQVGDQVIVNPATTSTLPVARTLDVGKEIWLSGPIIDDEFRTKLLLLATKREIFFFEPSTPALVIEVDIDSATPKFPSGRFVKVRADVPARPGQEEGWVPITTLGRLDKDGPSTQSILTLGIVAEAGRQLATTVACLQSYKDMSDSLTALTADLQHSELVPGLLAKMDAATAVCSDSATKSRKLREDLASDPLLPGPLLDAFRQMLTDWESLNQLTLDATRDFRLGFTTRESFYLDRAASNFGKMGPMNQAFKISAARLNAELTRYSTK
jgi:hypothetical protein